MTLWRLEWLRLVRTRRLLGLLLAFVFFGITGPLLARYRDDLLQNVGGGITIVMPPTTPADGILNYLSNGVEIGLLVFALVGAGALAFDAHRETSIFLRTRVRPARRLVLVTYATTVLAGVVSFDVGAVIAWLGSVLLLGSLPAGGMLAGILLADLYLAFFAGLVAVLAARTSSVVVAAVGGLAAALLISVFGVIGAVKAWLPSQLVGALGDLAAGGSVGTYGRAVVVTIACTAALVVAAAWTAERREI